jgi:adenosine deaminase CECR1
MDEPQEGSQSQPKVDEEKEWELEEGIPQLSDPFIQKYFQGRDALIEQERKHRSDYLFRQGLSPMVREASRIVSLIRKKELRDVWNEGFEEKMAQESGGTLYPGMMFTLAKERMEGTMLWKILKRMPKAALLHAHMNATVNTDWLIEKAINTPGFHIYSTEALHDDKVRESGPVRFKFSSSTPDAAQLEMSNIWDTSYPPSLLIPVQSAAEKFPEGGVPGFTAWLKTRLQVTAEESLEHHHGIGVIWHKFDTCFPIVSDILYYEPIFRASIQLILSQLREDGIKYVELRCAFTFQYRKTGRNNPQKGYLEMLKAFQEEVDSFKATDAGKDFHGARIIWSAVRSRPNKSLLDTMQQCITMKLRFPDLICGFDLVGPEDAGRPLKDLTPLLFWFRKACAEEGIEIPFFFHAGECLGDGDTTDRNLFDAVLLGTRRIGHGISLYKHPLLIEMVKDKKILIESCPISNEILRYTSSILSHPLPALLARGVPCCLNNDAPAMMGQGTNGLTRDYWQALNGWENLGLEGLAEMAENSVRYAAFEDQNQGDWLRDIKEGAYGKGVKGERLKEWNKECEGFCEWVVREFALEVDDDGDE